MEKRFRVGDIILFDGLYGCTEGACTSEQWGTSGRRLAPPACGHHGEWKLIRRRVDRWW